MLRLGTVFSGIGAIEHALKRMEIPYEIVFACDNGDIDILSKSIEIDLESIREEIHILNDIINTITELDNQLSEYKELLSNIENSIVDLTENLKNYEIDEILQITKNVLKTIINFDGLKKERLKEYNSFISKLSDVDVSILTIRLFKYITEVLNDYKKNNSFNELLSDKVDFVSSDNIPWNDVRENILKMYDFSEKHNIRKGIKEVRDISERLGMLHEKINEQKIQRELSKLNSYKDRKDYVDNLYKGKETQNKVKQSYKANYDIKDDQFHWNVSFLDGKQYKNQLDLFVGGSPCQSFSLVGKQRGLEDTRGTLFYDYARLVSEIRPKVFIYENVKAVLSNDGGRTWETMQNVFKDLDYTCSHDILNAKDFGIPQNRERLFVVGFRNDLTLTSEFVFPNTIVLEETMQNYLLENVSGKYYLNKKGVDFVTSEKNLTKRYTQIDGLIQLCQKKNQQFNWHGDFVFEEENNDSEKTMLDLEKYFLSEKVKKYVLASGTKGFYSKPRTDLEIARPLLTTMHKMHRAGVDNYVTTEGRLRKLTPRECLRLMGFCDSYKIVVSDTSMYQQAGNSIVVDVLIAIVCEIMKVFPKLFEKAVK